VGARWGRPNPIPDPTLLQQAFKIFSSTHLAGQPLFQSLGLGGRPVLIGPAHVHGVVPARAREPRVTIRGQHAADDVAQVGHVVDVGQGRGDEEVPSAGGGDALLGDAEAGAVGGEEPRGGGGGRKREGELVEGGGEDGAAPGDKGGDGGARGGGGAGEGGGEGREDDRVRRRDPLLEHSRLLAPETSRLRGRQRGFELGQRGGEGGRVVKIGGAAEGRMLPGEPVAVPGGEGGARQAAGEERGGVGLEEVDRGAVRGEDAGVGGERGGGEGGEGLREMVREEGGRS
jgi:hypothetical protein